MLSISFTCYAIVAAISLIFGLIYLTRTQFMPYHSLALAKSWFEVEPNTQTLILALMRVAGVGFLATGMTILVLLAIPFQAGQQWAIYTIPLISLITSLGALYATYLFKSRTPGNPPIKLSVVSIILIITGFVFSLV